MTFKYLWRHRAVPCQSKTHVIQMKYISPFNTADAAFCPLIVAHFEFSTGCINRSSGYQHCKYGFIFSDILLPQQLSL